MHTSRSKISLSNLKADVQDSGHTPTKVSTKEGTRMSALHFLSTTQRFRGTRRDVTRLILTSDPETEYCSDIVPTAGVRARAKCTETVLERSIQRTRASQSKGEMFRPRKTVQRDTKKQTVRGVSLEIALTVLSRNLLTSKGKSSRPVDDRLATSLLKNLGRGKRDTRTDAEMTSTGTTITLPRMRAERSCLFPGRLPYSTPTMSAGQSARLRSEGDAFLIIMQNAGTSKAHRPAGTFPKSSCTKLLI